ncbi:uncharacterized protein LOC119744548 [Patiria miniata]|uniref:Ig-like domain-containing protein n=1 Tax=Patiria miniata TaxID=46514 RepID=A0A914BK19_PATMI|nr:uncharacterized protein LOC119744548 [Patiria miniata]
MISKILLVLLMATSFNVTMPASILPESSSVTVRRGDRLQLSCNIRISASETILESSWIRDEDSRFPYDTVNVSTCRPGIKNDGRDVPCATSKTLDNRGRVKYVYQTNETATTTLIIDESTLEDNTTFRCVVDRQQGGKQQSEQISVTVYYLPNATTPTCTSSNLSGVSIIPSSLTCSAGESQPSVSLEWTAFNEDSKRVSLSNFTEMIRDRVENTLDLTMLEIPFNKLVFTCFMTSRAYPEFISNCSIGPFFIPTTEATTVSRTPSTGTDHPVSPLSPITDITSRASGTLPTVTDEPVSRLSPIAVIASTAGAGAALFIIIIIIVCVVSSRKTKKRREVAVRFQASASGRQQTDFVRLATTTAIYENQGSVSLPVHQRMNYNRVPLKDDTPSDQSELPADVYAYASVTTAHRQPTSPPHYYELDPDAPTEKTSDGYAYASVEKVAGQDGQDWTEDAASDSSWEDDDSHDQEPRRLKVHDTGATYSEIEQTNDGGAGDNDNSHTIFVDNILYVPSTNDVIRQSKFKGQPVA